MTRAAIWLLAAGLLLFIGVLVSQGLSAVFLILALAGWGLLWVALFHLVPLVMDAAAIHVLFDTAGRKLAGHGWKDALLVRWIGESANSLMPAGQLGGPALMMRLLSQRGMPVENAVAAITVSTTLGTLAQIVFTLLGLVLLGARAGGSGQHDPRIPVLIASAVLAVPMVSFYWLQRRGLFGKMLRAATRFSGKHEWLRLMSRAEAIDTALESTYNRRPQAAASLGWSLFGWVVGAGEVYLILHLLGSPVSWSDALVLESLGQAIRGAAFAIPGSLGVQEGGYLLLAPLAGLTPQVALALSLAKRARELLLAVPGLVYLHLSERLWRRRAACAPAGE
jgi:putative membrane protein